MDARVEPGVSRTETEARSTVNFDFIGDNGTPFVAHCFNVGDRESAIVQIGESALQSLVQLVLQSRGLLGRSEDASVNPVLLSMAVVGENDELDLIGCGGHANYGVEPTPTATRWHANNKHENHRNLAVPSSP